MSELHQHTEFLKALGLDPDRLTPEQIGTLSSIENPESMQPEQTINLFKTLGIDISKFLNNVNNAGLLKNKTRRNVSCPCGSDRKYKRCCGAVKSE